MGFCIECGTKGSDDAQFCLNCGAKIQEPSQGSKQETKIVDSPVEQPSQPIIHKTKKRMSIMQKIIIGVVAVLAIAVLGTKFYLDAKYDPSKLVKEMNTAFINEEAKEFYSYFDVPKDTVGTAENFYAWVDESGWSYVREQLEEQLTRLEKNKAADTIEIGYDDALIIEEEKILFGLSKKVTLKVKPLNVVVESNFPGTKVTIEGKEVQTKDEELVELGKFIPGTYNASYFYEGEYMPLKGEVEAAIMSYESNEAYVYIEVPYDSVYLDSEYDDAIIYINDKSTGVTIGEVDELYPVILSEDTKIHLVAKDADGKEIKSNVYPLTEDYIEIEFEADKELERVEAINEYYEEFRNAFDYALYYIDFSYIEDYFAEGSTIAKDYKTFVEDHEEIPGYYYSFISNTVNDIKKVEDGIYQLTSEEIFEYTSDDEDGTYQYVRQKSYKIKWTDDTAEILEIKDVDTQKTKL